MKRGHLIGFMFGVSQFFVYNTYGALFYAGGLMAKYYDESPEHIFIAIFAMMFGAFECGQSQ